MTRRGLRSRSSAAARVIFQSSVWRRKRNCASVTEFFREISTRKSFKENADRNIFEDKTQENVLGKISTELRDERGSAVVEFVVLTLPLFVPFALYLGVVNSQSQASFDAHNLARQTARAFITSPSEDLTSARVNTVVDAFTTNVLERHGITKKPTVSIECASTPCLTPGSNVKATVTIEDTTIKPSGYLRFLDSGPTKVIASDTQVVDIWRNTN